jgi:hypothetical protein
MKDGDSSGFLWLKHGKIPPFGEAGNWLAPDRGDASVFGTVMIG